MISILPLALCSASECVNNDGGGCLLKIIDLVHRDGVMACADYRKEGEHASQEEGRMGYPLVGTH